MAAYFARRRSSIPILLALLLPLLTVSPATAVPLSASLPGLPVPPSPPAPRALWLPPALTPSRTLPALPALHPRGSALIEITPSGITVVNNITGAPIAQSSASDGSGFASATARTDASAGPAGIVWAACALALGAPLALAAVRGARVTTAAAMGLVSAGAAWTALVNALPAPGLPDLLLTAVVLGFFLALFLPGLLSGARRAGLACLGLAGGAALGARVPLLRTGGGLLVRIYALDWVLVGAPAVLCGLLGLALPECGRGERALVVGAGASAGTFLVALGTDLLVNGSRGMSWGLRYLADRNSAHILDLAMHAYNPPISTLVIISVSLALIPPLAYAQHRLLSAPFYARGPLYMRASSRADPDDEGAWERASASLDLYGSGGGRKRKEADGDESFGEKTGAEMELDGEDEMSRDVAGRVEKEGAEEEAETAAEKREEKLEEGLGAEQGKKEEEQGGAEEFERHSGVRRSAHEDGDGGGDEDGAGGPAHEAAQAQSAEKPDTDADWRALVGRL